MADCYLATATLSAEGLNDLAANGLESLRNRLDQSARKCRGQLMELYIVTGDWTIMALFSFDRSTPAPSLAQILFPLATSPALERTASFSRLEVSDDLDAGGG